MIKEVEAVVALEELVARFQLAQSDPFQPSEQEVA